MDYSWPGSSVQGILQARILKRVAIFFSRGCSQPRDQTCVSRIGRQILCCCCCCCLFRCFSHVLQCDPMDYSLPGSSVHGILQARYWSGLPCPPPWDLPNPGIEPRSPALEAGSFPSEPQGKPKEAWLDAEVVKVCEDILL